MKVFLVLLVVVVQSRVVFVSIPFEEHLDPLLAQANVLRSRGIRVDVASSSYMEARVTRAGLPFIDLGVCPIRLAYEKARLLEMGAVEEFDWKHHMWVCMYKPLLGWMREHPTVTLMVADVATIAGSDVANLLSIPLVLNNPLPGLGFFDGVVADYLSLPTSQTIEELVRRVWPGLAVSVKHKLIIPLLSPLVRQYVKWKLQPLLNQLRDREDLPGLRLSQLCNGIAVVHNSAFALEASRAVPPNTRLFGPLVRLQYQPPMGKWGPGQFLKRVLVSVPFATELQLHVLVDGLVSAGFGVFVEDPQGVIAKEAQAIPDRDVDKGLAWKGTPSTSLHLQVAHCGFRQAQHALLLGVPLLCLPVWTREAVTAALVATRGGGRILAPEFSKLDVAVAAEKLLSADSLVQVERLQTTLRLTGGAEKAADYISLASKHGVRHVVVWSSQHPTWALHQWDVIALWVVVLAISRLFLVCCCSTCAPKSPKFKSD